MMFDRTIRSIAENQGYDYLFSCVGDYLKSFDLVVGNLEGPITENPSASSNTKPGQAGNTTFTFAPEAARALADHGIFIANLGNNHIDDFGAAGARATAEILAKVGIPSFGVPGGSIMATSTVHGVRLAFVNFNQFLGQGDQSKTIEAVRAAKKSADFVAVYAHWGEEYVAATDHEKELAHAFIDAGADAVFGSHPHVTQEIETYKEKPIYYSLGNFIFDQYWNESVRTGGGVEATLSRRGHEFSARTFNIGRDGRTCLSDPQAD
jgi:poly-gamma-glutamate synthesis protein (capsule biosynthesis protein)